jgi:hypothetical protein
MSVIHFCNKRYFSNLTLRLLLWKKRLAIFPDGDGDGKMANLFLQCGWCEISPSTEEKKNQINVGQSEILQLGKHGELRSKFFTQSAALAFVYI